MSAQKTKAAGHLAAIFTMLIWGTTFISTKVLLEDLSPLEILVLRFVAGYISLWIPSEIVKLNWRTLSSISGGVT